MTSENQMVNDFDFATQEERKIYFRREILPRYIAAVEMQRVEEERQKGRNRYVHIPRDLR